MQPFAALLLALALASSTIASPIADEAPGPIVIAPSWDNPKAGTTWQIGSRQSVQWNSDNVPPGIKADYVNLLLGYVDTDGNKHMDSEKPLATDIQVESNEVNIIVPNPATLNISVTGSSFVVSLVGPVLFGPNGAASPNFSITSY